MAVFQDTGRDSDSCDDDAEFCATLLRYHLQHNNGEPDGDWGQGVDEVDAGQPSLLEFMKSADLRMTKESLKKVLDQTGRDSSKTVNERHPSDGTTYGDVAVLHRLVIGNYTHQVELVTTLLTFSMADINLTTSKGKTAFHLAVELGNVKLMKALAALGADVNLPEDCIPCTRSGREFGTARAVPQIQPSTFKYRPTETESNVTSWAIGFHEHVEGWETSDGDVCNDSSPLVIKATRKIDMRTLLKEVGAMTPHTKKTHQHFPTKVLTPKARIDSELPTYLSIPDGEVSPDEAVEIVKRLQGHIAEQRRRGARVLCLDGGGARGLVQLEVLRQMEERLGGKIIDKFDYIVGTSAGGIIALALVYGDLPVWRLQRLYLEMDKEVFLKKIVPKGDTDKLESILKMWFRRKENYDMRMDEKKHPKCKVLISAAYRETSHVKLHWFNNFLNDKYSKEEVWKVARYTSAAPIYFTSKDNYVDGGLLANNPSLHALTTIQTHLRSTGQSAGVSLVVSVGTGINPPQEYPNLEITTKLDYVLKNKEFVKFMFDVVQSQSVLCEASCRCVCTEQGIKYVRLSPLLVTEVDPEETDNQKLLDMLWTTRTYLHHNTHLLDKLKQFFMDYID